MKKAIEKVQKSKRKDDLQVFIVRFAQAFFYTNRTQAGEPMGSSIPSFGTYMTYSVACAVARTLRQYGFADAVVALETGRPALPSDIEAIEEADRAENSEEYLSAWGANKTEAPNAEA